MVSTCCQNDTATMVLQEEELYEFMRNMTNSTSKGPSDAIHKAQWRVEQLNVAKDFIEIFDDIEVVMLEGQEANQNHLHPNPSDGHPSNHQSTRKVRKKLQLK